MKQSSESSCRALPEWRLPHHPPSCSSFNYSHCSSKKGAHCPLHKWITQKSCKPAFQAQEFRPKWLNNKPDTQKRNCQKTKRRQKLSVQLLSRVRLFATPWIAARQASLSLINSWSSLRLMSIESVMPSNHLILCRPLLLLPPILPSIRVFSNESTLCMRWPKYWSFNFSISPSNEDPGLISFRMDWLDLLAVQGTLKSLL